jgi:DNA-binding PadR family transcriptional regulator
MSFHADLELLILGVLDVDGGAHGYAIASRIRQAADAVGGQIRPSAAQLYPVLHRLERDGLIEARWVVQQTVRRPPRHVYKLTELGRQELEAGRADWTRFTASVSLLIDRSPDGEPCPRTETGD